MLKRLSLAAVAALCAIGPAGAQIKAEHPRFCVMSVGPTQMMFSAFQENRTDAIFCQSIPELGRTMIILDAKSNELRDMSVELRLLRSVGQKDWRDDLDANTVTVLPAAKYFARTGTASFAYDFGKEGEYVALVRAMSDDGAKEYVGQYVFSVGQSYEEAAAAGALAAVMGCSAMIMWRRSSAAKAGKPAPQEKPAGSAVRQST